MSASQTYTGNPEVDTLLFSWPRVIADAQGWERGFALSIQGKRKRPGWKPSHKEFAVMERLVRKARPAPLTATNSADAMPDDWDPIDHDD